MKGMDVPYIGENDTVNTYLIYKFDLPLPRYGNDLDWIIH